MKKGIKAIRISVFAVILIWLMNEAANTIVKCADTINAIKINYILSRMLPVVFILFILLMIILIKNSGLAALRVTILDVLSIVMFISFMLLLQRDVMILKEISMFQVQSNNAYSSFYGNGIGGGRGYADFEKTLDDKIEYIKKTGNHNILEEIYQIQSGENIFIYYNVDEEAIMEIAFFNLDDLYYYLGNTYLQYN